MFEQISIIALIITTLRMAAPIILAALGGVFSERAGVTNIGLEGIMLLSAFTGMLGSYYSGNAWIGVISAMITGILLALIHAVVSIEFGGNQAVNGMGLILLATGLSAFSLRSIFKHAGNSPTVDAIQKSPIFDGISYIGTQLASLSPLVYIALLLAVASHYVLYKTPLGLRITTVGEDPKVAETVGINVWKIRYLCVLLSGALAGLGGAYLSLGQLNLFQENMAAGRGFLALGAVIMGKWTPLGAAGAALFFGFFEALQLQLQLIPNMPIPHELLQTVPYIASIIILAGAVGKAVGPGANGMPYLRQSRLKVK